MKKIQIFCFCLSFTISSFAQQIEEGKISGIFTNTRFKDFVLKVESETPVKFYYREDQVRDIVINTSADKLYVKDVLDGIIIGSGLSYFIEGKNIYIYSGNQIKTELPRFRTAVPDQLAAVNSDTITTSEKKYLEGRIISSVEVLEIGDRQKIDGNSKCIISGKIVDESTLEPLIGATAYIEELKNGAVTDVEGRFKLALKPGKYRVVFNYMSMKQQEYYLNVYSEGSVTIKMKKELISLGEVSITASRYDHVKGIQMGFERISAKAMKEIPVLFGEKDVLKVAQMLPGVLNVGEGSAGFNVRGSAEDQNMFYINKIPVYNTSHLFGFFTSFNPDIINDFSFYKSNIPASFGGRLASVFNITTRQGSKRKFYGMGGISPITAHGSIEIPLIKDKVSVVASIRSSYSDWMLKRINDKNIKYSTASFYDGSLSVNAEINEKNLFKAFGYMSHDNFSLSTITDYNYSNRGISMALKHIFSPVLSADMAIIYSNYSFENTDKNNLSSAYTQQFAVDHYEARADFSILSKSDHKIDFGAGTIYYDLNRGKIIPYGDATYRTAIDFGKEHGLESAIYLSDEFSFLNNFTVLAGIRFSMFNQLGPAQIYKYSPENIRTIANITDTVNFNKGGLIKTYSGPEYRLALNYSLGVNSSIKASYNRMYQYIFMLRNTIAISPSDKWKLCDYNISPPVADQISVGYYKNFNDGGIKASVETYYKWIRNQVEYKDGTDFTSSVPLETTMLQGNLRVSGVELMINKNSGKTTGWLSYCYSRSLIKVDGAVPENRINQGVEYPSNFDRPHSFNLVLNYRTNRRLSTSATFVYVTGRPATFPISTYYADDQEILYFSKRNEFRIPDYARLDVSVNLEGNLIREKPIHSFWSVSVYNVLGRNNAYSIFFDTKDGRIKGNKLSIFGVPVFTISWNYKFGNYLNE